MTQMIRREAMTLLSGAGAGALLGLGGNSALSSEFGLRNGHKAAALIQGTLTPAHREGRRLVGFVETGVPDGHVLCSLVRQDEKNPAVQSVFASPVRRNGKAGVDVVISFFTEPVGDVTFSLLHVLTSKNAHIATVTPAGNP